MPDPAIRHVPRFDDLDGQTFLESAAASLLTSTDVVLARLKDFVDLSPKEFTKNFVTGFASVRDVDGKLVYGPEVGSDKTPLVCVSGSSRPNKSPDGLREAQELEKLKAIKSDVFTFRSSSFTPKGFLNRTNKTKFREFIQKLFPANQPATTRTCTSLGRTLQDNLDVPMQPYLLWCAVAEHLHSTPTAGATINIQWETFLGGKGFPGLPRTELPNTRFSNSEIEFVFQLWLDWTEKSPLQQLQSHEMYILYFTSLNTCDSCTCALYQLACHRGLFPTLKTVTVHAVSVVPRYDYMHLWKGAHNNHAVGSLTFFASKGELKWQ